MRIAFLADFHLGFGFNSEVKKSVFLAAKEAVEEAVKRSDLIVICGDIFDTRAPRTETFAEGIEVISRALLGESSETRLIYSDKEIPKICSYLLNAKPLIAIHGNHERKSKGEINPVKALEIGGLLIHLNFNSVIFEKNGERVAIHGMSNVPERYAKNELDKWNPKCFEDCFNILVLHQSIDPYVYSPLEPPTLSIKNLPNKFDLIVDGHIHQSTLDKVNGNLFLIPGSTSVTQFEKKEANSKKGFYIFDTLSKKYEFVELKNSKKFFFEEMEIESSKPLISQIEERIEKIISKEEKPIIKIKLKGEETKVIDQDLKLVEEKFADKAILMIVKELESPEISEKIEFLRNLREKKLSIEEMGLNLLHENLKELNFSFKLTPEKLFNLFEKSADDALQILLGEQLTLERWKLDNKS